MRSEGWRGNSWAAWAEEPGAPDWPIVYTVETMCRALCTVDCGALPAKARAVAWALGALPEPWGTTAERSQRWRAGETLDRASAGFEVIRFVRWAAALPEHRA